MATRRADATIAVDGGVIFLRNASQREARILHRLGQYEFWEPVIQYGILIPLTLLVANVLRLWLKKLPANYRAAPQKYHRNALIGLYAAWELFFVVAVILAAASVAERGPSAPYMWFALGFNVFMRIHNARGTRDLAEARGRLAIAQELGFTPEGRTRVEGETPEEVTENEFVRCYGLSRRLGMYHRPAAVRVRYFYEVASAMLWLWVALYIVFLTR